MMDLTDPPIPVIPKAALVFLVCRTSRMMIMRVRTLSKAEFERDIRADQ